MVTSTNRLPRAAFPAFFASGRRLHSPHFTLVVTNHKTCMVSVVVSKKVAKTAVDRNRLRRRAYGVVERLLKASSLPGVVIILYKAGSLKVPRLTLQAELEGLLAQIQKPR